MKHSIKTLIAVCIMLSLFSTLLISCEKGPELIEDESDDNLPNDLIAYWAFDENGIDSSGNGHTATLNNLTPTTDRFGKLKGAYYFSGTNSYASVEDKTPLRLSNTDFTINAWVKLDTYNSSHGSIILAKRASGTNSGWQTSISGHLSDPVGVSSFGPGGVSINARGTKSVALSDWHMITSVYTKESGTLSIYIDGMLDNITSGILAPNAAIAAPLYIGKDPATNTYQLRGSLDDISIYGKALSSTEIQQYYSTTKGPTSNLIAYWPFDGNGKDHSGNGNTATLHNLISTTDRFGNQNGAYYFNGQNAYASVIDKATLRLSDTDFTLNAWVKLDAYNASHGSMIMAKRTSGVNSGWQTSISGYDSNPYGVMTYGPGGGSYNAWGSIKVSFNQWHMVTCVYKLSTQTLSIYINGVLDNTTIGVLTPNGNITAPLFIGMDPNTNTYLIKGALDDVRISGKALNSAEVLQFYNNTRALANGEEG